MIDNYKEFSSEEGYGGILSGYGVKIQIGGSILKHLDYDDELLQSALYEANRIILDTIKHQVYQKKEDLIERKRIEKEGIISLFGDNLIYVEEIPNQYYGDSDPYGKMFPWFRITTKVGHFVIGWRKRVIEINWKDTKCKISANSLFPDENVIKIDNTIHAWSLEDAKKYIKSAIENCTE